MTLKDSVMETPWHISTFDSPIDGISIRFAYLRPNKKAQRAILFLNGRSEWIEKYAMLPELFKLGDDVLWISLDHRGQGGSGGIRAHVDTYADFAVDAATALKTIAGDLPYAIISHSMGGLIALYGSLLGLLKPQALALSSPLLALPNTPIPRYLAKPLAQMIASTRLRFQPTGAGASNRLVFDKNNLTSSAQGFKLIAESPYPFVSPSFGWVEASFIACNEIFKSEQLSLLKTPVRILGGSEESVVDPKAWPDWCMKAAKQAEVPIDFVRIIHGRHELLNESPRIRDRSIALLKAWINRYLPPPNQE